MNEGHVSLAERSCGKLSLDFRRSAEFFPVGYLGVDQKVQDTCGGVPGFSGDSDYFCRGTPPY